MVVMAAHLTFAKLHRTRDCGRERQEQFTSCAGGARACIDLGVPPQRGARSLYSRSCCAAEARRLFLRFLPLALGISPRRQCPDHFRGILIGHAIRVGDAGMNAVESIEAIGPNAVDAPL